MAHKSGLVALSTRLAVVYTDPMPIIETQKGGTVKHRQPQPPSKLERRPALVCAYPFPLAMAVPNRDESVGRRWLAEQGLSDGEVSARHLAFSVSRGTQQICDVGSRNGTWLDGQPLAPKEKVPIDDGAVLRFGRTLLVYRKALEGPFTPAAPLGSLIGPFGLRSVQSALEAIVRKPVPNVLIEGETGTGKELAAAEVARGLGRAGAYVAVNVAGVAAGVFDSQLFGHVAGAFSDARRGSKGVLVAHDGGAVFLDEIGELALNLQPKLLRVLENREVFPVGAERPTKVDVLLIAATNRDLQQMVEAGEFRRDLLARLAMARVQLPPLRDRVEDLFTIAQELVRRSGGQLEHATTEVEAVERLMLAPWPSNVRELMATLERLASIDRAPGLRKWAVERLLGPPPPSRRSQLSTQAIQAALEACEGNESQAAQRLGISRGKLRRLLGKA